MVDVVGLFKYPITRTVLILGHLVHAATTRYNIGPLPLTNNDWYS